MADHSFAISANGILLTSLALARGSVLAAALALSSKEGLINVVVGHFGEVGMAGLASTLTLTLESRTFFVPPLDETA